ncbi:MAG: hypothetical protein QXX08_03375 [Candidatus Bathyarchaeia archaeon]
MEEQVNSEIADTVLEKPTELVEKEDEAFRQAYKKKKARLRTRGPYRKAHAETF